MELQQSELYSRYVISLGWNAELLNGIYIYYRRIPFLGGLAKIQRSDKLPDRKDLIQFIRSRRIRILAIEPSPSVNQHDLSTYVKNLSKMVKINSSPFIPTKTLLVDLKPVESDIFKSFSETKRRAVRKAIKNQIVVRQSQSIEDLIRIKNKSAGMFGFITTYGIRNFWQIFGPEHLAIVLAYQLQRNLQYKILGGILLLSWNKTGYYWIAGSTRYGKKLFAPTLLVWEAIKLAKAKGNRYFDFVGVWDERMPGKNREWSGFTKFKLGFSQKSLYYPVAGH